MKSRNTIAASIMVLASLGLTACNPPMPPEVAALLAEQSYTCVEGDAKVSSPALLSDVVQGWSDSLTYSCVDPLQTMTMSVASISDNADIQISEAKATCEAKVSVPLAVEASVLIFSNSELSSLYVSEKSLAGILEGSIQNWSDLQSDNPGSVISKKPLKLVTKTIPEALNSVNEFLTAKKLVGNGTLKLLPDKTVNIDSYSSMEDGSMAIVPNSYAVSLGLYPASIYLGLDSEGNPILGNPDVNGIQAGASQWDFKPSKFGFDVSLNYSKEPSVPEGFDTAPTPYQIVYPVNLYLCKDTLLNRAVSRFVLRLDSQGALGLSYYAQIPEVVRVSALLSVSEGLPTPTPTPTE